MNKQDLVIAIFHKCDQPPKVINAVLDGLFAVIHSAMRSGDEVTLTHVGKLKPVDKPARTGRNPATGEAIEIPARTTVKLSVAKELKDALA